MKFFVVVSVAEFSFSFPSTKIALPACGTARGLQLRAPQCSRCTLVSLHLGSVVHERVVYESFGKFHGRPFHYSTVYTSEFDSVGLI